MAKLYFKYGAMGSSKTANALITKFNYEERGMKVWLIKPALDNRDGIAAVRSRIGLSADAYVMQANTSIFEEYKVDSVVYGHLHGKNVRSDKLVVKNGIKYLTKA